MYYVYNGTYFEKDRPSRDWNRLPDLYSYELPAHVADFEAQKK